LPKIDRRDILILIGLACIGAGVSLWAGYGQALTIDGAILLLIGLMGGREE